MHIQKVVGLLGVLAPGHLEAPISLNTDFSNTRSTTVWGKSMHIRKVPPGKLQSLEEASGPMWTPAAAIPSVHPHATLVYPRPTSVNGVIFVLCSEFRYCEHCNEVPA